MAAGSTLVFGGNTHFFVDNKGKQGGAIGLIDNSYIKFLGSTQAQFERNQAQEMGGGIFAEDSNISATSYASLIFNNNTGYSGGALALFGNSSINLQTKIQIQFQHNHAKHYGGAIFVNDYIIEIFNKRKPADCFFKVETYPLAYQNGLNKKNLVFLYLKTTQHNMLAVLCMVVGLIFAMLKHIPDTLYFTCLELEFLIRYS